MTELLLRGGAVHTFDDDRTVAEAVLFRDGHVAAVGDTETVEAAATNPRIVDLDGRVVLPGFNDAHTHLLSVGIDRLETDLAGADDRAEALSMLRENATATEPGEWVLGYNFDETTWPDDDGHLTRTDLDAVSEEHPVAAMRVDGHAAAVNGPAVDRVDLDGVERDVKRDDSGEPTGVLVEDAAGRVKQATYPRGEKARRALAAATERAHELGVTSVQNMSGLTAPQEFGSPIHAAFFGAWRDDELGLRVTFYVHSGKAESLSDLEIASGFGDDWLRIGGLKTFSDGSLGARTGKISGTYVDDPDNDGTMVTTESELSELFRTAARADQQIATHALGDVAIDTVLDCYEAVLDDYRVPDPRLRIEHVELATDAAIDRMAELGIVASMQPNFLQWAGKNGIYETVIGSEARGGNNRFRSVRDAGVPLAFGSDTMPIGPLHGIHHAVNAPHDTQRLSVDEAIAAYTRDAAYAEFTEAEKGTLEPGKLADAVVLGADPFAEPESIADIDVDLTVVDGEIVHEDPG
ncbi:amidohydrolase [Halorubrum ezzemoulense]|uniref:amidohydrolase n=1 Tax=Halorubrum ezzemoulense TaxID=337243 RepID=UPI001C52A6B3|nr:amidohydrolase [Halorubrum ezzemoulense]